MLCQKLRFSIKFAHLCRILIVILLSVFSSSPVMASPGSYTLTFRAADPGAYPRKLPANLNCPGTGRAAAPLAGADSGTVVSSLAPQDLALGQIVPFEIKVRVSGSTSPENGAISFVSGFDTKTSSNGAFGFDSTYGVYCAFVDTADTAHVDPSSNASVTYTSTVVGDEIQGTFNVTGLNNGDTAVVEVWMVLKKSVPQNINGNVPSRMVSAKTASNSNISVGNQNIPLSKVQEFFTEQASVIVQKMDAPDPVDLLGKLDYNIEVTNQSADTVANNVTLSDTMDANTGFTSVSVVDTKGSLTTCSHNGATAGGIVTCDLGFLEPLESVVIKIKADVLWTAKQGPGGNGPCNGTESICNRAQISLLNDSSTSDNTVSQPTGVTLPGPFGALAIDKVPNADVVYPGTQVVYAYEVTNSGTYPVLNVNVSDDKCSPVTYVSGDTNSDGELNISEKWKYQCTQVLDVDTVNIGTATATDKLTNISLHSTNTASVNVINPGISLVKTVDQGSVVSGTTVTYSFAVTNTGDDPLDQPGVADPLCSNVVYASGDSNSNGILDPSETWVFTCSTVIVSDTVNTAKAHGSDSLRSIWYSSDSTATVTVDDCPSDPLKKAAGVCGCGVADTDTDGDGTADCNDSCSADANKTSAGVCGCGVADTDTDGDGTADCNDSCSADANKTSAGVCGCGVADTDTDGDGTADCNDSCSADANKTTAGVCGCGVADTDTDGDGAADCNDSCSADANKTTAGVCGCGVADTDTDGDGTADCNDSCSTDANKTTAGVCGCGVADTDTDGDGTADCKDSCSTDASKTSAGVCGCGVADTDTDNDGTPDCNDSCSADASKTAAGVCGCGVADTDTDGDGTANCNDSCSADANKTAPGLCGCGVADTDSDNDGTPDCNDSCSADSNKTSAGVCGCGVADTDSDGDGTPDCNDSCSADANKTTAGVCGCGVADTDTDGDGAADCNDSCSTDANKTSAGICGCGVADTDTDNDGTADCNDSCVSDPAKTLAGVCGCGVADTDTDNDGTADCNDSCSADVTKIAPGLCGCGVADTDTDGDGTPDCNDSCSTDSNKTSAGLCGCGVADTDTDGDGTPDCSDSCSTDAAKVTAGICGCGVSDVDTDGDGTADCKDTCLSDANKTAAGVCGCGVADTDTDNDGTADCNDSCSSDANKTSAGLCGCGVADTDTDGDGTPDCNDSCSTDPNKIFAGACGCGVDDTNSDNDEVPDCNDSCQSDPFKTSPGLCGCGVADTDSDQDGTPDCLDTCSDDPLKTAPGSCGCGSLDTDTDGDGTPDCKDSCINDPKKVADGFCGCGVSDVDTDNDGTPDCFDSCPGDSKKKGAGLCGCGLPDTDSDNDGTPDCSDLCAADPLKMAPGSCGCGSLDTDANKNGTADCLEPADCAGVRGGSAKVDNCGVCNGDGSSCLTVTENSCTEVKVSSQLGSSTKLVLKTARAIRERTDMFHKKAVKCGVKTLVKNVTKANSLYSQIDSLVSGTLTKTVVMCTNSVCSQSSTGTTKKQLSKLVQELFKVQKTTKLGSIKACKIPPHKKPDNRMRSEDYRDEALKAVVDLPDAITSCK